MFCSWLLWCFEQIHYSKTQKHLLDIYWHNLQTDRLYGTCTHNSGVMKILNITLLLVLIRNCCINELTDYAIFDFYFLCFWFTENRSLLPAHQLLNRKSVAYLPVFGVDVVTILKEWVKRPASSKPPNNFSPVGVYKLGNGARPHSTQKT